MIITINYTSYTAGHGPSFLLFSIKIKKNTWIQRDKITKIRHMVTKERIRTHTHVGLTNTQFAFRFLASAVGVWDMFWCPLCAMMDEAKYLSLRLYQERLLNSRSNSAANSCMEWSPKSRCWSWTRNDTVTPDSIRSRDVVIGHNGTSPRD